MGLLDEIRHIPPHLDLEIGWLRRQLDQIDSGEITLLDINFPGNLNYIEYRDKIERLTGEDEEVVEYDNLLDAFFSSKK